MFSWHKFSTQKTLMQSRDLGRPQPICIALTAIKFWILRSNMVQYGSMDHWLDGPLSSHHISPVASMASRASDINMAAIAVPACHKEWSLNRGKLEDLNLIVNHGSLTHDMCDKAHVSPYEGCPIISKALVLAWHSRPNCNMLGSIAMATGKELMWKTLVFSAKILTIDYIRAPDFCQIWIDSEHVYQLSIFSWHPHYCQIWRTQC